MPMQQPKSSLPLPPRLLVWLIAMHGAVALRWRVEEGLHTAAQVAAGVLLGAFNAVVFELYGKGHLTKLFSHTAVAAPLHDYWVGVLCVVCVVGLLVVGSAERWSFGTGKVPSSAKISKTD